MILKAYYQDRVVLLNVPTDFLVFDGKQFVAPDKAKTVALVYTNVVAQPYAGEVLTWTNTWICKVISVEADTDQLPTDVIMADPPADGMCICGVTCFGANLQYVTVQGTI